MADITLTIDGISVTVPEGTNVVDAAREVGISIPVFCYHPRMKAVGMCRMCLVSVGMPRIDRATGQAVLDEEGNPVVAMLPKLQTACTTPVSPGMVVHTDTKEVKDAQRGILEFLLTSHPLDCPVCDKGGECPLQNLTMDWGPGESRYDYADKVHQVKPVPLGSLILLDRERCILCGRCVRFQDEVADDQVLGFSSRGRAWHIISMSDPPFDSKFSGNTTDICPVGALTTADFRFRARVWELQSVPSLCIHCSVGCNLMLDMRLGEINRVMPRENAAVNDIWICDKGRFGQRFIESEERLTTPLIRKGNDLVPASWNEAIQMVAEKMATLHSRRTSGSSSIGGLTGERLSNEDFYLFQRLFREVLGSNNLDHRVGAPGEPAYDDIGVTFGVGVGTNLLHLGKGTTVLVIGADPEEEAPIYMQRLRGIQQRGGDLIVANVRPTKLDRSATWAFHYKPGTEQQFLRSLLSVVFEEVNIQQLPQRTSYNQADMRSNLNTPISTLLHGSNLREDDIRAAAQSFAQAENCIIVYGADAMATGTAFLQELSTLLILTGKPGKPDSGMIPLLRFGNSRGALDMGIRPDSGPGYPHLYTTTQVGRAKETAMQPGLSAREMWGAIHEGQVRGMYIAGLDPATDYPQTRDALEKLEFLVVQDMFLTPTAQRADVVLPSAAFAERDGTYTNAERRVQPARQARPTVGESRPDWAIFQAVAQALLEIPEMSQRVSEVAASSAESRKKPTKEERKAANSAPRKPPAPWNYFVVSDVANDIAAQVPCYENITYTTLANIKSIGGWGRQVNEELFYDGTSYENTESYGIQYPSPSERPNASYTIRMGALRAPSADRRYPFRLLVQHLLYDGDPLLCDSLLTVYIPEPYVVVHQTDAEKLGITDGNMVQVVSQTGSLDCVARIGAHVPSGSVLFPAHLTNAPLAVIQTGPHTFVAIEKKTGG